MNRVWLAVALGVVGFAQEAKYQSMASTKQLMAALHKPSMDALAAMSKAGGPKDDAEWAAAKQHAALLGEGAQLTSIGGRAMDQDLWFKMSQKLVSGADGLMKAADAKDVAAWKTAMGEVGGSCRGCHTVHRKKPAQ